MAASRLKYQRTEKFSAAAAAALLVHSGMLTPRLVHGLYSSTLAEPPARLAAAPAEPSSSASARSRALSKLKRWSSRSARRIALFASASGVPACRPRASIFLTRRLIAASSASSSPSRGEGGAQPVAPPIGPDTTRAQIVAAVTSSPRFPRTRARLRGRAPRAPGVLGRHSSPSSPPSPPPVRSMCRPSTRARAILSSRASTCVRSAVSCTPSELSLSSSSMSRPRSRAPSQC